VSTQAESHSAKPASHTILHVPPEHVAVAFGGTSHGVSQPPQCLGSERVSAQVEPQASKLGSQAIVHAPPLQRAEPFSGTPQEALHAPQ
jgi:hypothetical protein